MLLEKKEEWEQLLGYHNNIIYHGTDPQDVIRSYMTKGRILDEYMERAMKAHQHYVRSLQIDPNQPAALLRLGELALRREDWYEAQGYAQRGLQLVSQPGKLRGELLLTWAAAKKGSGDGKGAEAAVVDARASNPELNELLGDVPLDDLNSLREGIRNRLPI